MTSKSRLLKLLRMNNTESPLYQPLITVMEQNNGESDFLHTSRKHHHQTSLSNMEINLEKFHKSLASVSTFATRRQEQLQPLIIYEITSTGESNYKSMTLRELLLYVNRIAAEIDEEVPKDPEDEVSAKGFRSSETDLLPTNEIELEKVRTPTRRRASSYRLPSAEETTLKDLNTPSPSQSLGYETSQRQSSVSSPLFEEVVPTAVKSLRLRDLRRLDSNTSTLNDTAIVVKRHVVIFAMVSRVINSPGDSSCLLMTQDPICAVIMADRLLFVVPDGADSLLGILSQYMKGETRSSTYRLKKLLIVTIEWVENRHQQRSSILAVLSDGSNPSNRTTLSGQTEISLRKRRKKQQRRLNVDRLLTPDISFEAHAYEALLMTVKEVESQQLDFLLRRLKELLRHYRQATLIPWPVQSELRQAKNDLSVIGSRLRGAEEALQRLMEDEEEMARMNLSLLQKKPSRSQ